MTPRVVRHAWRHVAEAFLFSGFFGFSCWFETLVHQAAATAKRVWTGTDALLLLTASIWGANYSIIKVILRHISPRAFIALRLTLATLVFIAAIAISRRFRARGPRGNDPVRETIADITPGGDDTLAIFRTSTLSRRDWMLLGVLGFIGHFLYQAFFIEGLARTQRRERFTADRVYADGGVAGERGAGAGALEPDALDRHGAVAGRHLRGGRPRQRRGRRVARRATSSWPSPCAAGCATR